MYSNSFTNVLDKFLLHLLFCQVALCCTCFQIWLDCVDYLLYHWLYLQKLIRLPPKISDSDYVINFFEVKPEDISPPT